MKLVIALYNNLRSSLTALGMFGEILAMIVAIFCVPFILLFAFFQKTFRFLLLFIYELNYYSAKTLFHLKNSFSKLKYIRKLFWHFNDKLIANFIFNDKSKQSLKPQNPRISFWKELLKAVKNFFYNIMILVVFIILILICIYGLLVFTKVLLLLFNISFEIPFISYLKNTGHWVFFVETRFFIVFSILLIVIFRFLRLKKKYTTVSFTSLYTLQSLFWTDDENASFRDIYSVDSDKSKKAKRVFSFLIKDPESLIERSQVNKLLQEKYQLSFSEVIEALTKSATIDDLKAFIRKLSISADSASFCFPQFDKTEFIKEFELLKESLNNKE